MKKVFKYLVYILLFLLFSYSIGTDKGWQLALDWIGSLFWGWKFIIPFFDWLEK